MKSDESKKFVRRFLVALACSTAPFAPVDQARAQGACVTDPTTSTVTCSGGDIPGGFGTGIETGLTINIDTNTNVEGINVHDATINNGSSIAPTGPGATAILGNNITLNNGTGTVSGFTGIQASSINVTSNDGRIVGTGDVAILGGGTVNVANGTGTISGVLNGILGGTVSVTINNGTIEATNARAVAIQATGDADVTNGSGSVLANANSSIAIGAAGNVTVRNGTGTIQANGTVAPGSSISGIAIEGATVTLNGNNGVIEATGTGGIAILTDSGGATVTNGTGRITGNAAAIKSNIVGVNANAGTIEATGPGGIAIDASAMGGNADHHHVRHHSGEQHRDCDRQAARGRIGYAFGDWLVFAAGGFAAADLSFREGAINVTFVPGPQNNGGGTNTGGTGGTGGGNAGGTGGTIVNDGGKYYGWSVGGGIEHAFTANLVGRIEYFYDNFGHKDYVGGLGDRYRVSLTGQTVRAALAWKFDPFGR
jgi:opacity protein-like surface antigen